MIDSPNLDPLPTNQSLPEGEANPPRPQKPTSSSGNARALGRLLILPFECPLTPRSAFEVREVKIRALQEAIRKGAYHVPAEDIADKILRSISSPEGSA